MAAKVWYDQVKATGSLDPRYGECPTWCGFSESEYDISRQERCDKCPVARQMRITRQEFYEALEVKLGPDHGFVYEELEAAMHALRALEPLGDRIFYKNYIALSAVLAEKPHA